MNTSPRTVALCLASAFSTYTTATSSATRVLAYQLLHSGTAGTVLSIPLLVFCTRAVSKRKRERLEMEDRQRDLLPKLSLFQLVQYSKILFIDADTLVTKPLDFVFHDEGTLTQATGTYPETIKEDNGVLPRTCMFSTHGDLQESDHPCPPDPNLDYSNGGFLLFTPKQTVLNYAHTRDGNMPWKPLWHVWNVNWPTEKDWRGGAHSFRAN
ncbi:hypothetical protein B0A54_10065 [Friedmanniomyces endolithicus]|uniref:Nucleotide-diphospho-sugar transferase n=1 Tax=Friedmanniomyces endolithicus TaxID=329885 RepID=A0A4V5N9B7_9PEZI|nr:hypothetical protein B0A54_10065 [Friedmanniomyces endolithicus]